MELTLVSMIEALGGWEIVLRTGSVVALAYLLQAIVKLISGVPANGFIKRGTAFIGAAIVGLLFGGDPGLLGRNIVVNFFCATVLWSVAIKPLLKKMGEDVKPVG